MVSVMDKIVTSVKTTKKKSKPRELKSATISTSLIPLDQETWLVYPISVAMMRHDYSLLQGKVLVNIIEHLTIKDTYDT